MNTRDTELIYEAYSRAVVAQPIPNYIIIENINILNAALDIIEEQMDEPETPETSKPNAKSSAALDTVQTALDVVGVMDPVSPFGTGADVANGVISLIRAALSKESDQAKRHLLNAAISAVSVIPAGDLAKALKTRKITRPLAKGTIKVAKAMRNFRRSRAAKGAAELADRFLRPTPAGDFVGEARKVKDPFFGGPTSSGGITGKVRKVKDPFFGGPTSR